MESGVNQPPAGFAKDYDQLSKQALETFFTSRNKGEKDKRLLIVDEGGGKVYLSCVPVKKIGVVQRIAAAFGVGNAAFQNIATFCANTNLTHNDMPKTISDFNARHFLPSKKINFLN